MTIAGTLANELRVLENRELAHALVVEDDAGDAELTMRALEAVGAMVTVARTGDEALELLKKSLESDEEKFDVVFLDLALHGSIHQGYDVMKYVREHMPTTHIVVVTGTVDVRDIARESGYIGVVQKPLERIDARKIVAYARPEKW